MDFALEDGYLKKTCLGKKGKGVRLMYVKLIVFLACRFAKRHPNTYDTEYTRTAFAEKESIESYPKFVCAFFLPGFSVFFFLIQKIWAFYTRQKMGDMEGQIWFCSLICDIHPFAKIHVQVSCSLRPSIHIHRLEFHLPTMATRGYVIFQALIFSGYPPGNDHISHLGKRNIIFISALVGDDRSQEDKLVSLHKTWGVLRINSLVSTPAANLIETK